MLIELEVLTRLILYVGLFPKEIMLMDTLMKYFEFTSTASQTGTTSYQGTFFPRNSASIIDTITVFINGAVYENITSYNHLFNIIYDNTAGFNYYNSGIRALCWPCDHHSRDHAADAG